jgi:hypothetical protein
MARIFGEIARVFRGQFPEQSEYRIRYRNIYSAAEGPQATVESMRTIVVFLPYQTLLANVSMVQEWQRNVTYKMTGIF